LKTKGAKVAGKSILSYSIVLLFWT